jgi:hypothetical protein
MSVEAVSNRASVEAKPKQQEKAPPPEQPKAEESQPREQPEGKRELEVA